MASKLLATSLLLLLSTSPAVTLSPSSFEGCAFKGNCGKTTFDDDLYVPCVAEGSAKKPNRLSNSTIDKLVTICPDFNDSNGMFCCDDSQVDTLIDQIEPVAGILQRCPSCYANLVRIFCQMTCSPQQSEFINVTASVKSNDKNAVDSVSFYLDEDYIERAYASCAEVLNPQSGLAIELICGVYGSHCSPKNLLKAIGQKNPSPISIDFQFQTAANFSLFNRPTAKCNESPFKGQSACGCADCSLMCPPFPIPEQAQPFCVLGIDGFYVVFATVFIVLLSASLAGRVILKRRHDDLQSPQLDSSALVDEPAAGKRRSLLRASFERIGTFCASRPWSVILTGVVVCALCCLGNIHGQVVTDPVELWSAPTSVARRQRNEYDANFGPFYRIEQVIVRSKRQDGFSYRSNVTQETYEFSSVFRSEFLSEIFDFQENITNLIASFDNGSSVDRVRLEDICFSPLRHKCAIQSVPNWFQGRKSELRNRAYLDHIVDCISNPTLVAEQDETLRIGCLGEFGGPSFYYTALGGYDKDRPWSASALVLTFIVNNYVEPERNLKALAWEKAFVEFVKSYRHDNMSIAFMSESSITLELNSESRSDVLTIAISYALMFIYVAVVLGRYRSLASALLHSQLFLGAMGVLLVLLSVAASVGIYSWLRVPSTLIVLEVVPFLALAIGVDNIFILVQAYQRSATIEPESVEQHVGRVLGVVGPSMLMASVSEVTCFFLASLTDMPAVRTFALYAALSLLIDFVLQVTVFVAMLSLDLRRQRLNRLDLFCCLKSSEQSTGGDEFGDSLLYRFMKNVYSPLLKRSSYRTGVMVVFFGWFCFSASVVHKLDVGLDQELSVPSDSYLQDYFRSLKEYLRVGPPVYFVVRDGYNYSDAHNQNLLGAFPKASNSSLVNTIKQASSNKSSPVTFIAAPAMSWIDDFFSWTKTCCFENSRTHSRCAKENITIDCVHCPADETGRPVNMTTHIRDFLSDLPNQNCPKGGHAAYSNAIEIKNETVVDGKHVPGVEIGASSFMSYHSVLKTSSDYIEALKMARHIAAQIETNIKANYEGESSNVAVFPYSIFYVFYEQYLTIWTDAAVHLSLSFGGILLISLIFMKLNVTATLAICLTILMIVVDLMGVMYLANVSLNAISLVNLVMCVGISVEFCSHIVKAYVEHTAECSIDRAISALANTGSSVLSGITCTKFVGVVVLAFSKSQLFVVFYFRMYLAIVLIGSIHGLVFLPVFLAVFGTTKKTTQPTCTE